MFEKNLEYINNEALKRRLSKLNMDNCKVGITYCITPSNDYILLKNDLPIDDVNNPREAVKKHLDENIKKEMKQNDIIINFGIGLGYLLDETFNRYPSRIHVYEPDLDLLYFVLNNVDLSEHLSSGRVFITNDIDELMNKLTEEYLIQDKVEITYIPNYGIIRNNDLLLMTQRVLSACKSKIVDINTINKFSRVWLENTLNNIAEVNEKTAYLLSDLENQFIGQTALVLGAGPSLQDNIEKIKRNRSRFVIFAVNKAIKYLAKNEVFPDFVVCLDAGNMNKTLDIPEEHIAKMNCILDIRTDSELSKKPFKKFFLSFAGTDFITQKLAKYNSKMKFYESGGTSAILAMVSAIKLGFSKLILAGVDLAFKDNLIYADGGSMERLSQEDIVIDSVKKKLVQVPSVTGDMVYTRDDYAAFVQHFATVIKDMAYTEIYNISSFGATIPGVKPVRFESIPLFTPASMTVTEALQPFKFELKDFIQDEFFNINNIISILSKGNFSSVLISAILKSVLVYQYMQSDILRAVQTNLEPSYAETFISDTKAAIKVIVELLQRNKLI